MIFFKNTVCDKDGKVIDFTALDGNYTLGSCTLVLCDKYAEVTKLSFDDSQTFIAEGLLKSAYNYAAIKNYYMAKCCVEGIDMLLLRLGFEPDGDVYTCDIPTILTGSCGSCSK